MNLAICKWFTLTLASFYLCLVTAAPVLAQSTATASDRSIADRILSPIYENLGHLILTAIAIWLAYHALKGDKELRKRRFEFEQEKFKAEEDERLKLTKYREQEYKRFSEPAGELAKHLSEKLIEDPHWAYLALESAKLLPYKDTLFDERIQHFRQEKQELAIRFTPYLLKRCEHIITNLNRDVWLLIDAGTTLFPFFEIIGKETAKLSQKGEGWLNHLHLATNNLPGIEQIIKTGRRIPEDRYSNLAIDCFLLPGVPVPIFAAVAGKLTNKTIFDLRKNSQQYIRDDKEFRESTFISLVVGNWIRIRDTHPRCPVPMARGVEHLGVKQAIIENSDEIFVVTPLGKIFVDASNKAVNDALGFKENSPDTDKAPYIEVKTEYEDADTKKEVSKADKITLVTTTRSKERLLYRHSNSVEDALGPATKKYPQYNEEQFAKLPVDALSYMLFPFNKLPDKSHEEFLVEFPHYHTRNSKELLDMFSVKEP